MPIKATFTGDVTDLRRGTQQARDEFRKVGTEAEGAARQLRAVGSSFDGSRLEGQARRVASGIERIGGASRLTDSELTRNSRTISEVLQKYQRMGVEAPTHIRRLSAELQQAQVAAKQLATTTSGIGATLSRGGGALLGGLGLGLGAGAGLGAITAIGAAISDIAADGARMAPLQQSFEKLQGGAVAANRELQRLRGETRGLVSDTDLMRQSNQASQLQLTKMGVDMGELAGAAVTLGRAVGNDATASIDDLIGALGRGSTEVLDNLGITLKVAEAQEIYADRINKTVAELTDQEKKQAFVTIGLERALEAAERLGEQQLTVMEQATRITTALGDMGAGMVSAGNQSVTLAGQLGGVADAIERIRNAQPGEVGDLLAGMLSRAGQRAVAEGDEAFRNAPWYKKPFVGLLYEPKQASGWLAQTVAPWLGDPNYGASERRTSDIALPTMPGAAAAIGGAGAVAELNAAREALARLTSAQREAIRSAKELGQSNKEAAQAAGTSDAVVRLLLAQDAAAKKATGSQRELNAELAKLTGADIVTNAITLAQNLDKVGTANVLPASMPVLIDQLTTARNRASELGPEFAGAVAQLDRKLRDLVTSPAYREIFQKSLQNPTIGVNRNLENPGFERTGVAGAIFPGLFPEAPRSTLPQAIEDVDLNRARNSIAGITVDFGKGLQAARNTRLEVRNLAQSFAQLAQIAGPAFGDVTRGIGTTIASLDTAGQLVDSLASALPKLGLTKVNAAGQTVLSGRGQALAGGLGALSTGAALGSMTSNPVLGGALGAGGGLATGAMLGLTGATLGATAGIGAAAAIYMAWRNRQAEKKALSEQRAQVIAAAGGYEQFKEAVEDAGFSFDYFLTLFNSNDADTFTDAMNRLNVSIAEQQTRASTLAKGLAEVARVQGVISRQQWAQIRNTEGDDAGAEEIVAFAAQQRAQAEQGLANAIAAITPSLTDAEIEELTRGISDVSERARVIEAELVRRSKDTLERFGSGAKAAAAGLFVAFSEAVAQGESAIDVLRRMQKPIQDLQQLYARAGQTPGAGFQQLQVDSEIATNPQTAPAVQLAQGLGQALAGFANSGLLSPELFGDLANGIGEAYHQLELFGRGGLEAARLMQPSLQAIWQMLQDTPTLRDELDDTTLALLDFAEQEGLIGDAFRPAIDRMLDAMDRLIDKLDDLVDAINDVPGINIPVTYTPGPFPAGPGNGNEGGDGSNGDGSNGDGTYGGGADGDPTTPFKLGGIVTRPTRALIGEAGPEAVISLEEYRNLLRAQTQMNSARAYIGASANHNDVSRVIGRIEPLIAATSTRLLSALDETATTLRAWAGQLPAPASTTFGGVTRPLPSIAPDESFTRLVPPGTREPAPPVDWFGPDGWGGRAIRPDDPDARPSLPGTRERERLDPFGPDGWGGRAIKTDEQAEAERQALIAATGGRWTGQPGLRERLFDANEGIHRPMSLGDSTAHPGLLGGASPDAMVPLSRSGASSAPIQITVISQIDGYEAARAITRHQPDVYRTYGAA